MKRSPKQSLSNIEHDMMSQSRKQQQTSPVNSPIDKYFSQNQNQYVEQIQSVLNIQSYHFQEFLKKLENVAEQPIDLNYIKNMITLKFNTFPNLTELKDLYKKNIQKQIQNKQIKRNWNEDDLQILVYTVYKYHQFLNIPLQALSEQDWAEIGKMIPGKNKDECKYKWLQLQKLSIQQVPWTKEEDDILSQLVQEKGKSNWSEIAKILYEQANTKIFRQSKKCRERFNNHLDPEIKKGAWTKVEDNHLLKLVKIHGKKWADLAKLVEGRTENAVKNRYNALIRKQEEYDPNLEEEDKQEMPENISNQSMSIDNSMRQSNLLSSSKMQKLSEKLEKQLLMQSVQQDSQQFQNDQEIGIKQETPQLQSLHTDFINQDQMNNTNNQNNNSSNNSNSPNNHQNQFQLENNNEDIFVNDLNDSLKIDLKKMKSITKKMNQSSKRGQISKKIGLKNLQNYLAKDMSHPLSNSYANKIEIKQENSINPLLNGSNDKDNNINNKLDQQQQQNDQSNGLGFNLGNMGIQQLQHSNSLFQNISGGGNELKQQDSQIQCYFQMFDMDMQDIKQERFNVQELSTKNQTPEHQPCYINIQDSTLLLTSEQIQSLQSKGKFLNQYQDLLNQDQPQPQQLQQQNSKLNNSTNNNSPEMNININPLDLKKSIYSNIPDDLNLNSNNNNSNNNNLQLQNSNNNQITNNNNLIGIDNKIDLFGLQLDKNNSNNFSNQNSIIRQQQQILNSPQIMAAQSIVPSPHQAPQQDESHLKYIQQQYIQIPQSSTAATTTATNNTNNQQDMNIGFNLLKEEFQQPLNSPPNQQLNVYKVNQNLQQPNFLQQPPYMSSSQQNQQQLPNQNQQYFFQLNQIQQQQSDLLTQNSSLMPPQNLQNYNSSTTTKDFSSQQSPQQLLLSSQQTPVQQTQKIYGNSNSNNYNNYLLGLQDNCIPYQDIVNMKPLNQENNNNNNTIINQEPNQIKSLQDLG